MAKRGVDISSWNDVDFNQLKNEVDFVIIRVGYGTKGTVDPKFYRHVEGCINNGIPFGFYWYSYALNVSGAHQEAQNIINLINPYKDQYSYGVWFDMEDADGYKAKNGMPSNQTLRDMCDAFCSDLEAAGYYAGIYASLSWFNNQLAGDQLARYDHWIAQWPTSGGRQRGLDVSADERSGWNLWQFTSEGSFSGIGRCDVNYAYIDYPGIIRGGQPQPEPTPQPTPGPGPDGSVLDLAEQVMLGNYGDGEDRKNALGSRYDEVQDFINHIFAASVDTLAQEVTDGKYGNGDQRKNVLGPRYNEVQDKVNQIYGGGSTSFNKGDRVRVKSSATNYCTGQAIPGWVKDRTYTIIQVGSGNTHPDGVLLSDIVSWVKKSDVSHV